MQCVDLVYVPTLVHTLITPGKPLPRKSKMLVELSHVLWFRIKIMNADHKTRFLTFRPALLSYFTLVSFRITLVLFALALSVYFVFCFLCQILRENIEHCSGNLFQISFKHQTRALYNTSHRTSKCFRSSFHTANFHFLQNFHLNK